MPLSALDCPDGLCHAHHGGHAVAREEVERNLADHGSDWCERLAERIYEIAVDSFCQSTSTPARTVFVAVLRMLRSPVVGSCSRREK